jgi:UDP-N-acetylmuramyl pentapeptide phosphotransferase/UDP-N-acetylglucosamine-1-phosphate transferase
MLPFLGIGIGTAVLAYFGVSLMLKWTTRRELFDIPNHRSSHTAPTPKGGGLVMVIFCLAGCLIFGAVNHILIPLWWYLAGGAVIAVVSWIDDVRELPSAVRFSVHGIAAGLAIAGFGYWSSLSLPFLNEISLGRLGLAVTIFWIVGLTNAFNFMDGIDGIAGLQAVVSGLAWALLGWWTDTPFILVVGVLIGFSSLGFLAQNWSPARIFMGDVGSAFLGFAFAVLPLMASSQDTERKRYFLTGVLIIWPFVFDSAFTLVRRALRGENVIRAHRSHLYQRMVMAGWSHRRVTSLYGAIAVVSAAVAVNWQLNGPMAGRLAVVVPVALGGLLWLLTIGQERRYAGNIANPDTLAG